MKKKGRSEEGKCVLGGALCGKNRGVFSKPVEKALSRRGGKVQWKVTREKGACRHAKGTVPTLYLKSSEKPLNDFHQKVGILRFAL